MILRFALAWVFLVCFGLFVASLDLLRDLPDPDPWLVRFVLLGLLVSLVGALVNLDKAFVLVHNRVK